MAMKITLQLGPLLQLQPITNGNIPSNLLPIYSSPSSVTSGLAQLSQVDCLIVQQHLEWLEIMCGRESQNNYSIFRPEGQPLFKAVEISDFCNRYSCGVKRAFDMEIRDNSGNELIHLYRPLACGTYPCPCSLQKIEVYCPAGIMAGTVEEIWSCTPNFLVKDAQKQVVLRVEGPSCGYDCGGCGYVEFSVLLATDGDIKVGKICKLLGGLAREWLTDADCFLVQFPLEADLQTKALLLGALFLIDFMFFERADTFWSYLGALG